jgi:protocatechuate 3,4-dioxygenase beta subunit
MGEKLVIRLSLLVALTAAILAAQDKKCSVEGHVFNLAGAPLKRASVRLEAASLTNQANFADYSVSTDNDGKFIFEDVTPGTYILSAGRLGYLKRYYGARLTTAGATQIKLDAGQTLKDIVFKLTPQSMILGKVVDDNGEPLSNVRVVALRPEFSYGKKTLGAINEQTTQADGSFVIGGLPAGRYYLSAEASDSVNPWNVELRGNQKPLESFLKTYFPSAIDPTSAGAVEVAPGLDARGVEIQLRRSRTFEIRGHVNPQSNGTLILTQKDGAALGLNRKSVQLARSGTFVFRGVPPGAYVICAAGVYIESNDATGEFSKFAPMLGDVDVTVTDRSLDNVLITLNAGGEIRGRLAPASAGPASVQLIRLDEVHEYGGQAEVAKDGTFRMQGVRPTLYRVNVEGLRDNTYLKAIHFAGQDLAGKDLDLTSGTGGEMELILSPDGAEVTGTVRDADGKAVPGAIVQICNKDGEVSTLNADLNGAFDLKGLAPADYKLFAWEDHGNGIISDPDFRKLFEGKSTSLTLAEKSRENVEPVFITKDAMDAEAAKIR